MSDEVKLNRYGSFSDLLCETLCHLDRGEAEWRDLAANEKQV
jgi:hypothetical protein